MTQEVVVLCKSKEKRIRHLWNNSNFRTVTVALFRATVTAAYQHQEHRRTRPLFDHFLFIRRQI